MPDGAKECWPRPAAAPTALAIGPDGALWIANNGGAFSWHEQMGLTVPGPTPPEHEGGSIQRFDFATRPARDGLRELRRPPADRPQRPRLRLARAASGSPTMAAPPPTAAASARSATPRPTARRSAGSATGCSPPTESASRPTAAPSTSPTPGSSASGPSTSRRRAVLAAAVAGRARPGGRQPARLPAARQPRGRGRRPGLRRHHRQRRNHRDRAGRRARAFPGPRPRSAPTSASAARTCATPGSPPRAPAASTRRDGRGRG